ncbi:hypothetical protein NSA50_19670 [Clostridium sp. DSM 100503]|uniref:hypothetical protein n=1 Tax=Clostridium sp. DSM 100503 TaxID=2963282 RepID=UPI00214A695B|nr:hypothetical protein [Clostridium sp. DSM 100503]MCR1953204.1 hypothetical protein [Clostridium sp. DSM 100503]
MLDEKEIVRLLKESLKSYIKCLEKNDFDFLEFKGEIKAYINVLNREDLKVSFLDMIKAKDLLNKI